MDKETALQQRVDRAERFNRIWEQEGFDTVTQTWERQLTDQLVTARPGEETERLKTAILMGRKFRDWLMGVMRDGEIARRELDEIRSGRRPFF